ncbi:MAG TPA: hypothetical protein VIU34_01885 [Steroidobacter sp.]
MLKFDNDATRDYGTSLLRARRLVERGVRFVHVVTRGRAERSTVVYGSVIKDLLA